MQGTCIAVASTVPDVPAAAAIAPSAMHAVSSSMAVAIEAIVVHLLASFAGFGPKHSSFAAMQ